MDLSGLDKGVYFVEIAELFVGTQTTANGTQTTTSRKQVRKIVKE
jgi:hypothetical protein